MLGLPWESEIFLAPFSLPFSLCILLQIYNTGPEETLTNFEVHLKNRQHRQKVNDRLAGLTPTWGSGTTATNANLGAADVNLRTPLAGLADLAAALSS